jgi:Tol biopolymer transport system component
MIVVRVSPETSGDVFLISISGRFEPRPLVATRAYEGGAQLSPDGRHLLYQSNESGQFEVYVRRYPALDRSWQASEGGAVRGPMAVFADDYDFGQGTSIANYDVTADGRFIMLRREPDAAKVRAVLNWTEELKRILATGGAR